MTPFISITSNWFHDYKFHNDERRTIFVICIGDEPRPSQLICKRNYQSNKVRGGKESSFVEIHQGSDRQVHKESYSEESWWCSEIHQVSAGQVNKESYNSLVKSRGVLKSTNAQKVNSTTSLTIMKSRGGVVKSKQVLKLLIR